MAGEPGAREKLPRGELVTGFTNDSGPQLMLIQLLPSSTVAFGVRLKIGFGMVASEMPGGTLYPSPPFSGGTRAPLQYWLVMVGFMPRRLFEPLPFSEVEPVLVSTEYVGASLKPEL